MNFIDLLDEACAIQGFCDGAGMEVVFHWRAILGSAYGEYKPRASDAAQFARQARVPLLRSLNGIVIDISLGALPFKISWSNGQLPLSHGPRG